MAILMKVFQNLIFLKSVTTKVAAKNEQSGTLSYSISNKIYV